MTPTWRSDDVPGLVRLDWRAKIRAAWRISLLVLVLVCGILATLLLRVIEVPVYGAARPLSGRVTAIVCRSSLWIMALKVKHTGSPMMHPGVLVANHSSWLDIFVLNASGALYFVSKSEVASWPGIGFLARLTGTVFVRREAREAKAQKTEFEDRLKAGHRLLFFPEGTSTDNKRVLPFKPTLFAALFSDGLHETMWVQPISVVYSAPSGRDVRFYGWWGDMDFGPHLVQVLAQRNQGAVHVTWHDPLHVSDFADRKALALAAEQSVRQGFEMSVRS